MIDKMTNGLWAVAVICSLVCMGYLMRKLEEPEQSPNRFIVTQTAFIPAVRPGTGECGKMLCVGRGTEIIVISRELVYIEAEGGE